MGRAQTTRDEGCNASEDGLRRGAARFGIDVAGLRFLGGEDGDVYEFTQDGQAFIFKLVPTSRDKLLAIEEKVEFVHYLADHQVQISRPLPSRQGRLIEIVDGEDEVVAVFKYTKALGHHPDARNPDEWNAGLFRQWGRVIGRMHALTQRYPGGAHVLNWREEAEFMANWCQDLGVRARWQQLIAYLETLPRPPDAYGLIHNDPHMMNMVLDHGELTIFDFDVCAHHWFATDIGIALFHALWSGTAKDRRVFARGFLHSFLDGYGAENRLDRFWLEALPHFLKYRQLLMFTVFCEGWTSKEAANWQKRWIADTRQRIVDEIPVLDAPIGELLP